MKLLKLLRKTKFSVFTFVRCWSRNLSPIDILLYKLSSIILEFAPAYVTTFNLSIPSLCQPLLRHLQRISKCHTYLIMASKWEFQCSCSILFFDCSLDDRRIGLIMIPTGLAFINYTVSPLFDVGQQFHLYLHRRSIQQHIHYYRPASHPSKPTHRHVSCDRRTLNGRS